MKNDPLEMLRLFHAELIHIRRDIHANPELGFEETRTSQLVADKLAEWGIEVHRGLAKTGVVGVVQGQEDLQRARHRPARRHGLPADARDGRACRTSRSIAGRMHACGHDGHTTMLLGAARYLAETRNFDGTAYLIFQPAEEGGGGGKVMVEEGLFERFPCDEIYALHNWPGLPAGQMAVRPGPMMAATDEIEITVRGRGGHAAMPHLAVDPVVITAHIITALQTIASRNVKPVDAIVVSLCSMETSQVGAFNVIPAHVELIGTVRTFRRKRASSPSGASSEIATAVAQGLGGERRDRVPARLPGDGQHRARGAFAAKVGEKVFGKDNVVTDGEPTMGGEDFSFMLQARPGAYVFLGQGGGPQGGCFLHNPGYDFNDDVIPLGAGYLAALVEESLPLK